MLMAHRAVELVGYGRHDHGDVITDDGEIIGAWSLVDDVFVTFTPDGTDKHIFFEPFVGILCTKIIDWHSNQ
ncbi:hypothetical protein HOE425_331167 [Hoeflea sp. EC-HK425]|nr:hypothetical protein HOE425_331167 [Hoeflea sp. EC-HK425]